MINTLLMTKARIDAKLLYLPSKNVTEGAVYITTDGVVPEITDYPAIALKDGEEIYQPLDNAIDENTLFIRVIIFVELLREEDIITADGSIKGVLKVAKDVKKALTRFEPDGVGKGQMFIVRALPSQEMSDEDETVFIQTKELVFKYIKDEQV